MPQTSVGDAERKGVGSFVPSQNTRGAVTAVLNSEIAITGCNFPVQPVSSRPTTCPFLTAGLPRVSASSPVFPFS